MSKFKVPNSTDNKLINEMLNNPSEKNIDKYYDIASKNEDALFAIFNQDSKKYYNLVKWLEGKNGTKDMLDRIKTWELFY